MNPSFPRTWSSDSLLYGRLPPLRYRGALKSTRNDLEKRLEVLDNLITKERQEKKEEHKRAGTMTYLQGVFSLHAIFCYFYGGVTFFNTELTVQMGLSHPEWSGQQYTVLMKMHGACVLGLGLISISAAQFEHAEPRNMIARCMLGMTALVFMALWQDWHAGGYSRTPVVYGVGLTTLAYLVGCTLLLDKDIATKVPLPGQDPETPKGAAQQRKEQ